VSDDERFSDSTRLFLSVHSGFSAHSFADVSRQLFLRTYWERDKWVYRVSERSLQRRLLRRHLVVDISDYKWET